MSRRTVTGAEHDAVSRWGRKYLCFLQRAGVRSGIKRQMRRRERRERKTDIRERLDP